jgi:predicted nucleotidyltransferase
MRQTLQTIYPTAAEEFARRVTSALGDQVDALVLFGSVARGEATRSSDIDIVVIGPNPAATRETISWIGSDLTYEHRFAFSSRWSIGAGRSSTC